MDRKKVLELAEALPLHTTVDVQPWPAAA